MGSGLVLTACRKHALGGICAAIGLGMAFAFGAVARTTHVTTPNTADYYATGQRIELTGTIADEPDRRPLETKYTIEVHGIKTASGTVHGGLRGRVLVTDRRGWPLYEYGDDVIVTGKLQKPDRIEDFHYDRYLSRSGIYSVIYYATVEKSPLHLPFTIDHSCPEHCRRVPFQAELYRLKSLFESQINRLLPEPHASFLAGLLTGSRRGIPGHLLANFNETGLTHIIAISGYNITIIIGFIAGLLFWLPQRIRFFPAIAAVVLFTVFVGANASVVRAAIMGILGLLAVQCGRQGNARLAILWTAFLMLLWNPKLLWYDAGWELSFLAVIGLAEIGPVIAPLFRHIPETLKLRASLHLTTAAQIAVLPLIMLLFHRFPLVAPLTNALVALAVPAAMLTGAAALILSFVCFPLGLLAAYAAWACLEWVIIVATVSAKIPFASIAAPHAGIAFLTIYYTLIITWIVRHNRALTLRLRSPSGPRTAGSSLPAGQEYLTTDIPTDTAPFPATEPSPSARAPAPGSGTHTRSPSSPV